MKNGDTIADWHTLADLPARAPRPSGDPDARIAPGRFTQFMEYMMVHRERHADEAVLEYSAPINFLYNGIQMPTDQIWKSSEPQKD